MPKYYQRKFNTRYHPYAKGSRLSKSSKPSDVVDVASRVALARAKRWMRLVSERKRVFIGMNDLQVKFINGYFMNPMSWSVIGTGPNQRIGDKISDVYLNLGFQYVHNSAATWEGSCLRIVIFKSQVAVGSLTSSWNSAGSSNFPDLFNDYNQISSTPTLRDNYVILYDKVIRSTRQLTGSSNGQPAVHRFNKKLCTTAQFETYNIAGTVYLKGFNYFVMVGASAVGSVNTDNVGQLQVDGFLYFRDT